MRICMRWILSDIRNRFFCIFFRAEWNKDSMKTNIWEQWVFMAKFSTVTYTACIQLKSAGAENPRLYVYEWIYVLLNIRIYDT